MLHLKDVVPGGNKAGQNHQGSGERRVPRIAPHILVVNEQGKRSNWQRKFGGVELAVKREINDWCPGRQGKVVMSPVFHCL